MKVILYLIILSLLSQESDPTKLYQQSNYSKALEVYLTLLEKDPLNPYLHYNIGNCHYKLGNKEMATASYLKAFIINPRMQKNVENLKKVSKETQTVLFADDIPSILYRVYFLLSDDEIKTTIHLMIFLISAFLLIWIITTRFFKKTIIILAAILAIFIVWHMLRKNSIFFNPAVILKETDIYSGPNDRFTVLATIPPANVVTILTEGDSFTEIGIPEQNIKGWVKNEDLIKIKKELSYENSNRK